MSFRWERKMQEHAKQELNRNPSARLKRRMCYKGLPLVRTDTMDKELKKFTETKRLNQTEADIVGSYVRNNGSIRQMVKDTGLKRQNVYFFLKDAAVKKAIRKVYRKMGINMYSALGVVKFVMFRKGDYHYDFNRLKAVDMYCKMVGGYKPKKLEVSGHIDTTNKTEIKATLVKLIQVLKESTHEKKAKSKDIIPTTATRA